MKIKETRRIFAEDLRNLCIRNNWYTRGNSAEYNHLLLDLAENKLNITTEDIVAIAEDIREHSADEEMEDMELETICFEVARIAVTFFNDVEKKYYDPEYDRLITEDVIKEQWEYFQRAGSTKSYEQFKEENFMDAKYYGKL